ncbi:hypothetical protein O0L34_g940 [Tuta absoluta]|nr:hypothetical protein O0L34_g940 [Tuta absoluta]
MDRVKIINNVVDGGPALPIPGHLNFGQYMIDNLKAIVAQGDKVAMVNGETGQETTYKQVLQGIVNVATGLRKFGVKRGDVIAFCSENRDEYIYTSIGVICCGATVTTANLQYTKDEMAHVLNISKPKFIFASEAALKLNLKTFKSVSSIKKIIQFNGQPLEHGILPFSSLAAQGNVDEFEVTDVQGATDVVYILYSSGTTGLPKGVALSHVNILYSASSFENKKIDEVEEVRILTVVPWYHAYGLMATTNSLAVGTFMVYFAGFNPIKYLEAIRDYKINKLLVVPPIVVFLAKAPTVVQKFDLSSVTSMWCGAAPLSADTISSVMKRLPNCRGVFQAYGMTETSLSATSDVDEEGVKPKPGSGGMPLEGVKAKVVDPESGIKLGPNQKGEICLKGPILMKGYIGNKKATLDMYDQEGYLKTGDIGYYDSDGCFFIVDRLKELIKYKGSQVPPAALESVILQHEAVQECGVVGKPDEAAGELPTAFIVLKPGAKATEAEILEFTNNQVGLVLQHGAVQECGVVGKPDEAAGELPTAFIVLKPGAKATEAEILEFTNNQVGLVLQHGAVQECGVVGKPDEAAGELPTAFIVLKPGAKATEAKILEFTNNQVGLVLQHGAVQECGVVGKPDEAAGELPTAFIVLKPGAKATEAEILEFTNNQLSKEKRLYGGVIFIDEIPKNASGKILRRVLKQKLRNKKKSKL